jgi:uncharacterized protein YbcI
VRLHKDQFGRGRNRVRTYWCSDDVLSTVREETLPPAGRNLVDMSEDQRLRDTRMLFRYATVRQFCEPVERLTGRRVKAFVSGIDTAVDGLAIDTFGLHPEGRSALSRIEYGDG